MTTKELLYFEQQYELVESDIINEEKPHVSLQYVAKMLRKVGDELDDKIYKVTTVSQSTSITRIFQFVNLILHYASIPSLQLLQLLLTSR
ncbi:unnamed protein product [Didymodactylos carnosus]|uniref:Uncharacterized protein n=1 Tax=Didymodactylos carnosus TaxID=1234261 RepID=A0A814UBN4_9BILA|nr:unnamed protein product [Didymodactylos carnosus]CAF1174477.1 unnamed protein product [Didymodactylos carnosus]CAF3767669.1 unnamed protein product [Didymodactylos carnosus]CAF3938333.1 unnamed protein product [Didymodactylos carnosus]